MFVTRQTRDEMTFSRQTRLLGGTRSPVSKRLERQALALRSNVLFGVCSLCLSLSLCVSLSLSLSLSVCLLSLKPDSNVLKPNFMFHGLAPWEPVPIARDDEQDDIPPWVHLGDCISMTEQILKCRSWYSAGDQEKESKSGVS